LSQAAARRPAKTAPPLRGLRAWRGPARDSLAQDPHELRHHRHSPPELAEDPRAALAEPRRPGRAGRPSATQRSLPPRDLRQPRSRHGRAGRQGERAHKQSGDGDTTEIDMVWSSKEVGPRNSAQSASPTGRDQGLDPGQRRAFDTATKGAMLVNTLEGGTDGNNDHRIRAEAKSPAALG
jgi:hypothetical protein